MNGYYAVESKIYKETALIAESDRFGVLPADKKIQLFTLTNGSGGVARVTNYGARLVSLLVPDQFGDFRDVVLGFSSLREYLEASEKYHGATIGRYANRIKEGKLRIAGKDYVLPVNSGRNHLHGGDKGFHTVAWEVRNLKADSITLTYLSKHMEEGYPGNLRVELTYKLTDNNTLLIEYGASTDRTTVVNLTHHSYFNLNGEGEQDIEDHYLQIDATRYTPIDAGGIPTGTMEPLKGSPLDFGTSRRICERIDENHRQLAVGHGYDHNYVLSGTGFRRVATAFARRSGITMDVLTDQPGMQLYTGNFLNGLDTGKSGNPYGKRSTFCLETQHFPDSPNRKNFPSVLLIPGERYRTATAYRFSTV